MRTMSFLLGALLCATGIAQAQLDTGPAGDAPFRQLPPPSGTGDEATAAEILNGSWGSSQGRSYHLEEGSFSRDGKSTMRLDCERRLDIEAITPIFECTGTWFERDGSEGGGYLGTLYWSGQRQSWYLEGAYSFAMEPDRWYGLNYGPHEGTETVRPLVYRDRGAAAESVAPGIAILSGLWASGDTRYEVTDGLFWREGSYVTLRLVCDDGNGDDPPVFECSGLWFGKMGENAGGYKGTLSWWDDPGYWYFKGLYNHLTDPDHWYGKNFRQLEGPGGSKPSTEVARRAPPSGAPSARDTDDESSPARDDGTTAVANDTEGGGAKSATLEEVLDATDDERLAACIRRAYDALVSAGLKVTFRRVNAVFAHDANFRARIRCPNAGDTIATTGITIFAHEDRDPTGLRDTLLGAMR